MKLEGKADIGIIGGTGSGVELDNIKEIKLYTPYGNTSDIVKVGEFKGKKVAFIARHGAGNFTFSSWISKKGAR
jgi:5'-methylthioadenosine phosphorylase